MSCTHCDSGCMLGPVPYDVVHWVTDRPLHIQLLLCIHQLTLCISSRDGSWLLFPVTWASVQCVLADGCQLVLLYTHVVL